MTTAIRQNITKTVAQTGAQNNLTIDWVSDTRSMERAAGDGLLTLYRDVFAEAPYFETFTDDEVFGFFMTAVDQGGLVLTARDPNNEGRIGAFVSSIPLAAKESVASHVSDILDTTRCAYFAEDGVAANLRRRGISGTMKKILIECNALAGFDNVLLRTSINSYPQISAVTKAGGRVISGLFQDVASPKQSGETAMDRRVFFLFNRQAAQQQTAIINRVTIAEIEGRNTAIIQDPVQATDRPSLALRLRDTYAAIDHVVFNEMQGMKSNPSRVAFDAKMYVPA
jgi:hypothetical protein